MELTIEHVKNTTAFRKDWQARGAIETLKWLEAGAPHQFDGLKGTFKFNMGHFVRKEKTGRCKTVCCIGGAIAQFGNVIKGVDTTINRGDVIEWGAPALDMIFGLSSAETDAISASEKMDLCKLFYLNGTFVYDLEDVGVGDAAATLRRYLETGDVVWPSSFYEYNDEEEHT